MSTTQIGPYRVGVTSSLAAGKSTFLSIAQQRGFNVINTDSLTHDLLNGPSPAYDKVIERFGKVVFDRCGKPIVDEIGGPIVRPRLAAVIFIDDAARRELEAIIHPAVRELCKQRIAALPVNSIVFVEVPLLFESNMEKEYDETLALVVNPDLQMERLLQRPNMTREHAQARINAQLSQTSKAKRATKVIDNSDTLEVFQAKLSDYFEEVIERAQKKDATRARPQEPIRDPWDCEPKGPKQPEPTKPTTPVEPPKPTTPAPAQPTPVEPTPGPVAQSPAEVEAENRRNREALKDLTGIVAEQALDKIGDVGSTRHKVSQASAKLKVGSNEPANGTTPEETEVQVDLSMSVKRNHAGAPNGKPCTCGCKGNCRNGCACATGCGCTCQAPPPTPPAPPQPPHRWCLPGWCRGHGSHVAIIALVVLALFGLLAYLHARDHGGTTVIVNPPVTCSGCNTTPPPVPTKPNCDPCSTPAPFVPSEPPPTIKACAIGPSVDTRANIPGFAFQTTQNWVRNTVRQWTVKIESGCSSATVDGTDAAGRLVTHQQYGEQLEFAYRWDISYELAKVQVDRFETFNVYVGRTVYLYDPAGKLSKVQQFDGHQRLLSEADVNLTSLSKTAIVRRYDALTGGFIDAQTYDGSAAIAALSANFYLFDTFKH